MAAYKVFFKKSVAKDFAAIPKRDLQRIITRSAPWRKTRARPVAKSSPARSAIESVRGVIESFIPFRITS
jgi:hypothetical protein